MKKYIWRTLSSNPLRLGLTIGGISLCLVLMFLLIGIYKGALYGSVEYIKHNKTDLWILQSNATNILRGSSIVSDRQADLIKQINGIKSVAKILFVLTTIRKKDNKRTVFLTGYDPEIGLGGPPKIVEGQNIKNDNEIVLDRSFAEKFKYKPGDIIDLQGNELTVTGICTGTNALVIQYVFVSLKFARQLTGYNDIATCFLLNFEDGIDVSGVKEKIKQVVPKIEVYDHNTFLANNIEEMESGFLPLLYAVAGIGSVVLVIILSLLLSVNILERMTEFALLKIIGSGNRFLKKLIYFQALIIVIASGLVATVIFTPLTMFIAEAAPEICIRVSLIHILIIIFAASCMSLLSSFISTRKLKKIYLLEVLK